MINKIAGPFVILSKTRQQVTSFDELQGDYIIFSTEDGTLLEFEDNIGSDGHDLILKFFDPTGEILLRYFETQRHVFTDLIRRYGDIRDSKNIQDLNDVKSTEGSDAEITLEGLEYPDLNEDQKAKLEEEFDNLDIINQSSNSFFIMYGTDNFKNAVPFKKISLASYVLDTGTDASYVVTAKFVSYPLSAK